MQTTLNKIRQQSPCKSGWERLLKSLNKTQADDEPVSIRYILESNGIEDAIWCLRAVENEDRKIRLFAVSVARTVQHLMKDQRSIDALDAAEAYANGLISKDKLRKTYKDAYAAADAAYAAAAAAYAAAADAVAAYAAAADAVAAFTSADAASADAQVSNKQKQKEILLSFLG